VTIFEHHFTYCSTRHLRAITKLKESFMPTTKKLIWIITEQVIKIVCCRLPLLSADKEQIQLSSVHQKQTSL